MRVDGAIAVVVARQFFRTGNEPRSVEQESAEAVVRTAGTLVVVALAGNEAGVRNTPCVHQFPFGGGSRIRGKEPSVEVDHLAIGPWRTRIYKCMSDMIDERGVARTGN